MDARAYGLASEEGAFGEFKLACKLAEKDLSFELFLSYLMDKVDLQREFVTSEEFGCL